MSTINRPPRSAANKARELFSAFTEDQQDDQGPVSKAGNKKRRARKPPQPQRKSQRQCLKPVNRELGAAAGPPVLVFKQHKRRGAKPGSKKRTQAEMLALSAENMAPFDVNGPRTKRANAGSNYALLMDMVEKPEATAPRAARKPRTNVANMQPNQPSIEEMIAKLQLQHVVRMSKPPRRTYSATPWRPVHPWAPSNSELRPQGKKSGFFKKGACYKTIVNIALSMANEMEGLVDNFDPKWLADELRRDPRMEDFKDYAFTPANLKIVCEEALQYEESKTCFLEHRLPAVQSLLRQLRSRRARQD